MRASMIMSLGNALFILLPLGLWPSGAPGDGTDRHLRGATRRSNQHHTDGGQPDRHRATDSLQAWQRQAASGGAGRPMTGSAYPMNDPQNNTDACNGSWKDVFEHAFPGERPSPAWTCVVPRPVRRRRISSIPWPWLKRIHAVVLAGGDTYGLDATLGVVSIIPCAGLLGLGLY
uniref:Uncharacterized protein n=1 Tax=Candidatus Kentrum sp. LFY TaxID=2126342 RepID=A0A450V4S5_9GAMM|nr:MAG: hypothetical protein BECKLFY1418B_GA0070995_10017 [Candidatus Kentron sp. LFY]VFJ99770.1 MAG: hypothetical protein BECKLFY1418A_GA0070994_11057 [Candidatus Kentron sp. LFY]